MAPRNSSDTVTYGSINNIVDHADGEETVPLELSSSRGNKDVTTLQQHQRRGIKLLVLWTVIISAVLVSCLLLLVHRTGKNVKAEPRSSYAASSFASPMDMGLPSIDRQEDALPSEIIWGRRSNTYSPWSGPLPTNSWYLNLLSHRAANHPDESTRVYTVPYIIDTAAAAALSGLRVHWPVVAASDRNIQMVDDYKNGISLGTCDKDISHQYKVVAVHDDDDDDDAKTLMMSHLGVSLQWSSSSNSSTTHQDDSTNKKEKSMVSHIVRGMPYATMQYFGGLLPSLYSYNGPASAVLADDEKELECGVLHDNTGESSSSSSGMRVERTLQLHFINSDFTWLVFFSRPVRVRCAVSEGDEKTREFQLSVVSYDEEESNNDEPLTVRLALLDQCTTGKSDITQHCLEKAKWEDQKGYEKLLKESAHVVPTSPQIDFTYPKSSSGDEEEKTQMTIDWGAQTTRSGGGDNDNSLDKDKLLMFALPHHQDSLSSSSSDDGGGGGVEMTEQCINTFHGRTCLVIGNSWTVAEDASRAVSFTAARPPEPDFIPVLADAISQDIHYRLSSNMLRGASDTYFTGKILARVGRVVLIASELKQLAAAVSSPQDVEGLYDDVDKDSLILSMEAAASVDLPSDEEMTAAVEQLKKGVEIWLSGRAEAPYVYDKSWGGLVNCGCRYVGKGENGVCNNTFPDCPALVDVNEDFGNGYYNDHHYHYGYHVYAAAVVAKFDPEWGEQNFDRVLLYIRDFANPFPDDEYFIQFRQKDWFLGSSWASGIVSAENSPHGRNQESSSEAIAAYEAVALYGSVMVDVFSSTKAYDEKLETARLIKNAGQLLTATELRATNSYWHVWSSDSHTNTYPEAYKQPVVGMLYETMASFQTWFAPEAVVSYGIQLIPFTTVAEQRDDPEWAAELYPLYVQSCQEAGDFCVDNGWSILQAGLCATAGNREEALEQALAIPAKVFDSQGGVGNSLTNTIWYIATRKPTATTTN